MRVLLTALNRLINGNDSYLHKQSQRKNVLLVHIQCLFICFVLSLLTFSNVVFAEPQNAIPKIKQNFNIPAGSLSDALTQFSRQAGVNIIFEPAVVKGHKTQGLAGNFEVQSGLSFLLMGSGLQVVLTDNGQFAIRAATNDVMMLPTVQVDASAVGGYAIASSTTATKTDTLIRDVPQSIAVVSQDLIQDQAIQSMGDAVRYIPGLGVSQGEGNRDALVFRGNRTTADFFVDGVRDDTQIFRDLYNIERIEVLKGTNGMIFGRGGSGGVINRVTKQANWDPIRSFSFQGGSFNRKRMTADMNQGINDKMAFRLNAMYEDAGSFRNGVNSRRLGIAPTITFKPSDQTTMILNMERFHDRRTADRGIPSFMGRPINVRSSKFFGDPRRSNSDVDVLSFNALIEHKFDFGLTVRNRTNYADYDKFYGNVYANGAFNGSTLALSAYNDSTSRENVFNQTDFLLKLDTGPIKHTLMAGVEVGRQTTDNNRNQGYFDAGLTQDKLNVSLLNSVTNAPIWFNQTRNRRSIVDVTSLYIQDQIELLPQLQAIVGVRYDSFKVDFRNRQGAGTNIKTNDGMLSPRFGLVYKPFEPISFYASFSRAFAPRAGEQLNSLKVDEAALAPEKFTNYEVGAKWDIRPDLALTGAVYRLDRTNVITPDPNNAALTFLSKGQRTEGIEVSIVGQLTHAWSIMGGYAYQEGEILQSLSSSAKKGAVLAELPKNTFSMWSRYDFIPGWGAAFGVIHRGSMFASTDNTVRVNDFTRVDAAFFGQLSKHVRAQINIENLFDTNYIAAVHNNNNLSPGSPIAIRASLIANF
ncbi:MAG: TonB-dependent siderophore receptor [Nitrosomonas sp.]|nr:TonB-dependent siderophore receptor [Nitrosomonas sp.]